jgi:hypothetical protein
MITTKLRAAGAALATSLFVASAGVLAYQGDALQKAEAPKEAAPAPKAAPSRDSSPRSRKLAWYFREIMSHAQSAALEQRQGRFQTAAEHTEAVQRLSHEWNWMVRHFDEERFPDSAYEPPNNPPSTYEFIPPRSWIRSETISKQPTAEKPLGPIAVEDDLAFPLIREKPVASPRLSDAAVRKPSGDADVRSRIERVERKLDEVLKALEILRPARARDDALLPMRPDGLPSLGMPVEPRR